MCIFKLINSLTKIHIYKPINLRDRAGATGQVMLQTRNQA